MSTPTPITSWDDVPLMVEEDTVRRIFKLGSYDAVKRAIKSGYVPKPQGQRPMRWSKATLMRHLHVEPERRAS